MLFVTKHEVDPITDLGVYSLRLEQFSVDSYEIMLVSCPFRKFHLIYRISSTTLSQITQIAKVIIRRIEKLTGSGTFQEGRKIQGLAHNCSVYLLLRSPIIP